MNNPARSRCAHKPVQLSSNLNDFSQKRAFSRDYGSPKTAKVAPQRSGNFHFSGSDIPHAELHRAGDQRRAVSRDAAEGILKAWSRCCQGNYGQPGKVHVRCIHSYQLLWGDSAKVPLLESKIRPSECVIINAEQKRKSPEEEARIHYQFANRNHR